MRWSDTIILICLVLPDGEDGTNDNGFKSKKIEKGRSVFGNKMPAWHSEFYKAQQTGTKIECRFEIRMIDYEGEELTELEGKRYKVLRKEESKNGEFITLTLSDLSERGETNG